MPHQIPTNDDDGQALPKMGQILGDGKAKSSVAYSLSMKDYGNGGDVHVSLALTHGQDEASAYWAQRIAFCTVRSLAFDIQADMKHRLVAQGLLKP